MTGTSSSRPSSTVRLRTRPSSEEEIFGPVVALLPAKDLDEAIALSNGTQYGLRAAIFTKDRDAALRYARSVDAGRVGVNTPTSIGDQTVPGGGRKNSGRGEYEGAEARDPVLHPPEADLHSTLWPKVIFSIVSVISVPSSGSHPPVTIC